jgi:CelD/BcsL family acetyltransferase involved in cellulose biosynthesis
VGLAPLFIERLPLLGPLQIRRLAFLGFPVSDYLDLMAEPAWEEACAKRLAEHLIELAPRIDWMEIGDIPDGSPRHLFLHVACLQAGLPGEHLSLDHCPRAHLQEYWDATLAALPGEHRRGLAKRLRQMREKFKVEFEVTSNAASVRGDVEEFLSMHRRRMIETGRHTEYADPKAAAFQVEVAQHFFARGWLFLAFLRLDGRRVACACSYVNNGVLGYYLGGAADVGEARRFSPGIVLHCLCMEEAIRRGIRVYDFLRGTEPYKFEFGAVGVPNWTVRVRGRRMRLMAVRQRVVRKLSQESYLWHCERKQRGSAIAASFSYAKNRGGELFRKGFKKVFRH